MPEKRRIPAFAPCPPSCRSGRVSRSVDKPDARRGAAGLEPQFTFHQIQQHLRARRLPQHPQLPQGIGHVAGRETVEPFDPA